MMFQVVKNNDLALLPSFTEYVKVKNDGIGELIVFPRPCCKALREILSDEYSGLVQSPYTDPMNKTFQYVAFDVLDLKTAFIPSLTGDGERVSITSELGINPASSNQQILNAVIALNSSIVYRVTDFDLVNTEASDLATSIESDFGMIKDVVVTSQEITTYSYLQSADNGKKLWELIAEKLSAPTDRVVSFFENNYKWDATSIAAFKGTFGKARK